LHAALIAGLIAASGKAVLPPREKVEQHTVLFVAPPPPKVHVAPEPVPEVKKPPPTKAPRVAAPPRVRTPPPPQAAPPRPQPTAPVVPLIAPVNVPVSIPKVDVNALPTVTDVRVPVPDPGKLVAAATGRTRGTSDGDVEGGEGRARRGLGSGAAGRAFSENQVERAVVPTRPPMPRYPDALKSVSITGEVVAQYIVDARGRVEPGSIKILSSTHRLFAEAVRKALLEARYRPAQVGGEAVRQLVEQPFIFKIEG